MSEPIHRLLYRSEVNLTGTPEEVSRKIDDIVEDAQRRNSAVGITGALVMVDHRFVQSLEGELATVRGVFERICLDMRHTNVELVDLSEAPSRAFGSWAMVRLDADAGGASVTDNSEGGLGLRHDMAALEVVRKMRAALRKPVKAA